jgi:molybdopterin molybdotransferase
VDTVESARARMLRAVRPLGSEPVPLALAASRTLAESLFATRDQPPFRSSAMDGYAVRSADLARKRFHIVGEAAAGGAYAGLIEEGEAVRIFTGAPVPAGADAVVPQERARRDGSDVLIDETAQPGKNIRDLAIDFSAGSPLIDAGTRLHPRHIALVAAAGIGAVKVSRTPHVAMLATGSELATPGEAAGSHQIYDSVTFGLGAMIESWGGCPQRLPPSRDSKAAVSSAILAAIAAADLVVIVGGASVGDYDVVKQALATSGLQISVPKVAVRPGKPTWFGTLEHKPILGLPGNPAAAFVCAALFLRPLLHAFLARTAASRYIPAVLDGLVEKCGENEAYLRARATVGDDARLVARPFDNQDTSLVSVFASANALIRRSPNSGPALRGSLVDLLLLDCE